MCKFQEMKNEINAFKIISGYLLIKQKKAETSALSTAKYLWNFLSGMSAKHNLQAAA